MKKKMVRIISILLSLSCAILFFFVFHSIVKSTVAALVVAMVMFLYAGAMVLSEIGMRKFDIWEKKAICMGSKTSDVSGVLVYALMILCPIYFCVFLVSLIPMTVHAVWFLTVFPCLIIMLLPIKTVYDEYYRLTNKRCFFILLNVAIIIFLPILVQAILQLFDINFI